MTEGSSPRLCLPDSSFLSSAAVECNKALESLLARCELREGTDIETVRSNRERLDTRYFSVLLQKLHERHAVEIESTAIAGVAVEIIVPRQGADAPGTERVILNLHGGSFVYGGVAGGRVESIPIAAATGSAVLNIDYRLAPEHRFPAASQDVGTVYRDLIRTMDPKNIAICGSSAGALLACQSLAAMIENSEPVPGALVLCAGGAHAFYGDSYHLGQALLGFPPADESLRYRPDRYPYAQGVDLSDPRFFPGRSDDLMSRFPPTLLISAIRDFALSSVLVTHRQLLRLGVPAELHVWEGLGHCFHFNPELEAAQEAHATIAAFVRRQARKDR